MITLKSIYAASTTSSNLEAPYFTSSIVHFTITIGPITLTFRPLNFRFSQTYASIPDCIDVIEQSIVKVFL